MNAARARHPGVAPAPRRPRLRWLVVSSASERALDRWLLEAASALHGRGHSVLLVAPAHAALQARAAERGLPTRVVTQGWRLDPRGFLRLRAAIAASSPHAILVGDQNSARNVLRASRFSDSPPIFFHATSGSVPPSEVTRAAANPRLARVLVDGSRSLPGEKVRWMPDGVALLPFPEPGDRVGLRRDLRLPRRVALAVQQGDFLPESGHETILRALGELSARRAATGSAVPLPTVAFIGTGPAESNLRVLAHDLDVKQHVLWLGHRKDVLPILRTADLALLPGTTLAGRWAALDAMASGLAIVASDAEVLRHLIEDDRTGLLVSPGDPEQWATAIDGLLHDPALADRLARAAWDEARTRWSHAVLGAELESLAYSELLARAARSRVGAGRRALFVDRDGTLIRNVPYSGDPAAVELEPGAARALVWLRDAGFAIVVVSNQSAVARGLCTEADVLAVNERMRALLCGEGADVDAIYYCPHHPDHGPPCDCRKPEPGLLLRAARELDLDLAGSVTVGDAARDLEAGRRAGTAVMAYAGREARPPAGLGGPVAKESREDSQAPGEERRPIDDTIVDTMRYDDWLELVRDLLEAAWAGCGRQAGPVPPGRSAR